MRALAVARRVRCAIASLRSVCDNAAMVPGTEEMARRARRAAERAGTNLSLMKQALGSSRSTAVGIAVFARAVAVDLGFASHVRWLDLEIGGYKGQGMLGSLLRVPQEDDLPARIMSYRQQRGRVSISTQSGQLEDLPYPFLFTESLTALEQLAAQARAAPDPGEFQLTIPTQNIPQEGIRDWLQQFGIQTLPIRFSSAVPQTIIAGFLREMAQLVGEYEATLKFNEALMASDDKTPSVTSPTFNIQGPVGNINTGSQINSSFTQNVGTATATIENLFKGLDSMEVESLGPLRRFLEESIHHVKSPEETDEIAKALADRVRDVPLLKKRAVEFVSHLPAKIAEHAVLAQLTHPVLDFLAKFMLQFA